MAILGRDKSRENENLYTPLRKHVQNEAGGPSIDMQLAKLEEDIRRLKIEFDIFFNGGQKRPPLEFRGRVEAALKRISDDRNLTFAQRYLFNSLMSRYTSYRELWRRLFKLRGDEIV
jgi:hypothetical protein